MWALTALAVTLTAIDLKKYSVFSMACYVGMGWCIVPFCRQVLQEFAPDLEVILVNCKGETMELTLKELLPYGFDSNNLQ